MNTPEIEYGQVVGTIGWAYEVLNNGEEYIIHDGQKYELNNHNELTCDKYGHSFDIGEDMIAGWTRFIEEDVKIGNHICKSMILCNMDLTVTQEKILRKCLEGVKKK